MNPNGFKHLESDSAMIQMAVDEAAKTGDVVIIPAYNERTKSNKWVIGKEIRLHTGSSICLQGCHLIQAEEGYECDDNRQEKRK